MLFPPRASASSAARTSRSNGSLSAQQALATLSVEYASLRSQSHCPIGMYVVPSVESMFVWDGVFFVHQALSYHSRAFGFYSRSSLRFRLTFNNYPEKAPAVHFITDVFHPLISQKDGLFSLAPRIPTWLPKEHHVFDVLHWIKTAFKRDALDRLKEKDCLNKEAYRYRETTSSFVALASQTAMLSQSPSALYDKDHPSLGGKGRGAIVFHKLTDRELQEMREEIGVQKWEIPSD
ncbi:hypothetical protein BOTBODRAFT_30123 [Botryobasidium botryosum FD-172 SS1]|uniref:UBC core domain-containing protein n=1 Tax=Botryobasidium botryosum (strain FD-172 SS1) TaxID=930990 RepID=A0A067MRK9_BOTB1|nr:hypothetical protein BOTBODRAFT_30123 [Botryobasidium botryosum FD-172 SS1]